MATGSVTFSYSGAGYGSTAGEIQVIFDYVYENGNTKVKVTNIGVRQTSGNLNYGSCPFCGKVMVNSTTAVYMDNSTSTRTISLGNDSSWHYPSQIFANQAAGTSTSYITCSGSNFSIKISGCGTNIMHNGIGGFYSAAPNKIIGYIGNGQTKSFSYTPTVTYYNVSYDANGGTSAPNGQIVTSGNAITLPGAISHISESQGGVIATFDGNGGGVTKEYQATTDTLIYTFEKWHAGSVSGTGYDAGASYTPTGDTTFYAGWNISLVSSGAITLPTKSQCYRTDYILLGWAESPTAGTAAYSPGAMITLAENKTFYAIWMSFKYVRIRISDTWEKATPCIYSGGKWVPAKLYIYSNGVWHYCGDDPWANFVTKDGKYLKTKDGLQYRVYIGET